MFLRDVHTARSRSTRLLLVDSRIKNLILEPFAQIGEYQSCTWPDLDESAEFNQVRLYRAGEI